MRRYSTSSIFISVLLVFSVFTLLSISEVNADEVISINAKSYGNTIIIEFKNDSTSKIDTVRMWPGGEIIFESFKSEPGWGGGKYSNDQMVIFTATNTLKTDESVKFGLITSEKVNGINWKALDRDGQIIDSGKISIQEISHTTSSYAEETDQEIDEFKEVGSALYGTKKFIPEKFRPGSDIRLVGNGFDSGKNLKFYLDNTVLTSVKTDNQGNFLATVSIPNTQNAGASEFIIKDEFDNFQSTNINIKEPKNRFLKDTKFEVHSIPSEVRYGETLTISGNAYPQSTVIIEIEDNERVLEKARIVSANSNGEWVFEETIKRTENLGEKYVIFKNNQYKTTKNMIIKTDYLIQISTSAIRYNVGDTVTVTGTAEPNSDTAIWIRDKNKQIMHYDVFTSNADGNLSYKVTGDNISSSGTYTVIIKQDNGADAALFGVGKYPATKMITLMEKSNFTLDSTAILNIIGLPSTRASITIIDSNDNIKITDVITTSSDGKNKYAIDLTGLSAGVYRAVVSSMNIQDSVTFSVGLESGSGAIALTSTQENYSPGDSVLIIGSTGVNARLTITLYDPDGNISAKTEAFSDTGGNFSTDNLGLPTDAMLGNWKITAQSRLDSKSINIQVTVPTGKNVTLQMEETDFSIGDTIIIKGVAQSDYSRLEVKITNASDEVLVSLATPLGSGGEFYLPWTVPGGIDAGAYTITVSDNVNSSSFEIFIQ